MKKGKQTMVFAGIIITALIIGLLSFKGSKAEVKVNEKITITRTTKTKATTTTKVTMKPSDDELITVEQCENIVNTLAKDPSAYSLENIKNCGYENIYDRYNYIRKFSGKYMSLTSLFEGIPNSIRGIDIVINNNTYNINFDLHANNQEKTSKTEKIAGVTKTLYDINPYTREVNIFFITNNGVYRFFADNTDTITKYSFDKISDNTKYTEMSVNRLGTNKTKNVFYYVQDNKYINIVSNTVEKNIKNVFYEDEAIKINNDRTFYISGNVKPFKVIYYITDSSDIITNIIDSDGYLYGYTETGKNNEKVFQKIDNSRISEILFNKNKITYNRYGRITTVENDNPNFILIFYDNSLRLLDYNEDIPLLNN